MNLKTFVFSEGAHFRITLGILLVLSGAIAAGAIWTANVENDIETNTTTINRVEIDNANEHVEIFESIEENIQEIKDMKEILIRLDENVKWIRDDIEKK